jgi:endonuclease/exonuclease/phosphatase family metal-dependent hydrolase
VVFAFYDWSMRARGRVRHAAVVVIAVATIATSGCTGHKPAPVPSESPPVGPQTIDVLQYNIAGAEKNDGGYAVIDSLVERLGRVRPDVVSLNEVCHRQYQHLVDKLKDVGYAMYGLYAPTRLVIGKCFDPFDTVTAGNALLVRGTFTEDTWYTFDPGNHYSEKGKPGVSDTRGGICLRARLARGQTAVRVCNAHLHQDGSKAAVQLRELAKVFGPTAQREPFILAGDMNLEPRDPSMRAVYAPYRTEAGLDGDGQFYEVDAWHDCIARGPGSDVECDARRTGQPTVGGNRKLDYIFGSRSHFALWTVAKAADPGDCGGRPCSDHQQLWGRLFLTRNGTDVTRVCTGLVIDPGRPLPDYCTLHLPW